MTPQQNHPGALGAGDTRNSHETHQSGSRRASPRGSAVAFTWAILTSSISRGLAEPRKSWQRKTLNFPVPDSRGQDKRVGAVAGTCPWGLEWTDSGVSPWMWTSGVFLEQRLRPRRGSGEASTQGSSADSAPFPVCPVQHACQRMTQERSDKERGRAGNTPRSPDVTSLTFNRIIKYPGTKTAKSAP